ncbi:hypothetical protein D9758_016365 [Tetrapyrgos nigripes]|uniref:Uncharacterized protein n=1 Tax=Tetrapyrgos nigripes TaxID=182062 RepID=A0A8H5CD35_9AGAR|nr:hypothetical protein D9758_016365 [Tetrapyrgos nigripes]
MVAHSYISQFFLTHSLRLAVMSNSTTQSLPNPFTPLAFLDPELASQEEVLRYAFAMTLGGYIWDCAMNIGSDYQLLFRCKISYPTLIYYLSRCVGHIAVSMMMKANAADIPNCETLQFTIGWFIGLSTIFTSLLLLFRVIAIWHRNKVVMAVFILLWLSVAGSSLAAPFGIFGEQIGQTCILTRISAFDEAMPFTGLVNDSAVFIAITYWIISYSVFENNWNAQVKAFFGGKGVLPLFSRKLLESGQQYYLVALAGNIAVLVLLKNPKFPAVYHGMASIPAQAVVNSMACVVFRQIKFGLISVDGTDLNSPGRSSMVFAQRHSQTDLGLSIPGPAVCSRNNHPETIIISITREYERDNKDAGH